METLEKLHKIEKEKSIYDIHYCKAGVGFLFYEPPKDFKIERPSDEWRKYLTVSRYHLTFEEAVGAEFKNLIEEE